jgi:hypothetical protein
VAGFRSAKASPIAEQKATIRTIFRLFLLCALWSHTAAATQNSAVPSVDGRGPAAPAAAPANLDGFDPDPSGIDQLAETLLLANLPQEYENAKHWGQTKQGWNGVEYRAWLIDPHRDLHLAFKNLRRAGHDRTAFELIIDAKLGATGRLSEWNRGVQLYSFHADAEATVRLQLSCELSLGLDAREINERRTKLVEKMNRSIEKHQGELRISVRDLLESSWNRFVNVPDKPAE